MANDPIVTATQNLASLLALARWNTYIDDEQMAALLRMSVRHGYNEPATAAVPPPGWMIAGNAASQTQRISRIINAALDVDVINSHEAWTLRELARTVGYWFEPMPMPVQNDVVAKVDATADIDTAPATHAALERDLERANALLKKAQDDWVDEHLERSRLQAENLRLQAMVDESAHILEEVASALGIDDPSGLAVAAKDVVSERDELRRDVVVRRQDAQAAETLVEQIETMMRDAMAAERVDCPGPGDAKSTAARVCVLLHQTSAKAAELGYEEERIRAAIAVLDPGEPTHAALRRLHNERERLRDKLQAARELAAEITALGI